MITTKTVESPIDKFIPTSLSLQFGVRIEGKDFQLEYLGNLKTVEECVKFNSDFYDDTCVDSETVLKRGSEKVVSDLMITKLLATLPVASTLGLYNGDEVGNFITKFNLTRFFAIANSKETLIDKLNELGINYGF
jgi:hypothetical protein